MTKLKLNRLHSSKDALQKDLRDPEFRAEWERTALARAIASEVIAYRVEQGLSQTALAERLGMKQPAVARLEAGDVTPTIETLQRLVRVLDRRSPAARAEACDEAGANKPRSREDRS